MKVIAYHGSRVGGFKEFNTKYIGTGVVGSNGSGGFYFSSNYEAASYFANPIEVTKEDDIELYEDDGFIYGEDGEYYILVNDEINCGPFNNEMEARNAINTLITKWNESDIGDIVFEDDRVFKVELTIENPLVVNSLKDFRELEPTAKERGYGSIIAKDIIDGYYESTVYVIFNPKNIKML